MQQIQISSVVHHRIAEYARRTGRNVSSVADEALDEWMDCHGEPVLKRLGDQKEQPLKGRKAQRKRRQPERTDQRIGPSGTEKVVPFPTGREA